MKRISSVQLRYVLSNARRAPELVRLTLEANGLSGIAKRLGDGGIEERGSFVGYRQQKLKETLNQVNRQRVNVSGHRSVKFASRG